MMSILKSILLLKKFRTEVNFCAGATSSRLMSAARLPGPVFLTELKRSSMYIPKLELSWAVQKFQHFYIFQERASLSWAALELRDS
jgi:hypothetical protein